MSGRKDLDGMSPEEIGAWAARNWAEGLEANADKPKPEISRVKRDDYPHWDVVAYEFHTRPGEKVLVGREARSHERWPGRAYVTEALGVHRARIIVSATMLPNR